MNKFKIFLALIAATGLACASAGVGLTAADKTVTGLTEQWENHLRINGCDVDPDGCPVPVDTRQVVLRVLKSADLLVDQAWTVHDLHGEEGVDKAELAQFINYAQCVVSAAVLNEDPEVLCLSPL